MASALQYYMGRSKVAVPGQQRTSNQGLGASRVGTGVSSTGMTTGGTFGSGLMAGRQKEPKAATAPAIPSRMVYRGEIQTDPATINAMRATATQTRSAGLRSALASQRAAAEADPRIAENIARNDAAIARQNGGAPIVTDPAKRQEMWDREMARKELRRGGIPNAMAGMLANSRNDPKTQGLLAAAMMGNPRASQALGEMENSQMRDVLAAAEARKLEAEAGAMERYNPNALSPEMQLQVQQTGEAARQAHLAANPGDEEGAILAAQQATGGRYVDVRTPQQIRQATIGGIEPSPWAGTSTPGTGASRSAIADAQAGTPEQQSVARRAAEENDRLRKAEQEARRWDWWSNLLGSTMMNTGGALNRLMGR